MLRNSASVGQQVFEITRPAANVAQVAVSIGEQEPGVFAFNLVLPHGLSGTDDRVVAIALYGQRNGYSNSWRTMPQRCRPLMCVSSNSDNSTV